MRGSDGRSAQAEMVVAHLSDPHLFVPGAFGPAALLDKRLLGGVHAMARRRWIHRREVLDAALVTLARLRPDHLLVTGDISTLGAREELEAFRERLGRVPLGPAHVTVIPGNHDAYVPSLVQAGHFEEVFASYLTPDPGFPSECWPRVRVRGSVAIIGCTTARPSLPFLAVGTLGADQRARLEALLAELRERRLFRLVALHHHPHEGVGHWHNRLTDAPLLRAILARQGAELVVHGHLHRALEAELPGPVASVPVVGTPSVSSNASTPLRRGGFRVFRIRGNRLFASELWTHVSSLCSFQREL